MKNRLIILGVFCCFFSTLDYAQDIHFSQFYASPLTLNPSYAGNFDGNWRFSDNYRRQWDKIDIPYNTVSVGFDAPFTIRFHKLGVGVVVVNDKSGDAGLTVNKYYISLAYHKKLFNQSVHFGIQEGFVSKSYDLNSRTYPSMFNPDTYMYDIEGNREAGLSDKTAYMDMNLGLSWNASFYKLEPYLGIALFHVNFPGESFSALDNKLPMRIVGHGGAKIELTHEIDIRPNILYMYHSGASDFMAGLNAGYMLNMEKFKLERCFIGAYIRNRVIRNNDAMIVVGGLNFKNFDFGVSYDITISKLSSVTKHRGAFEISFIYKALSTKVYKASIPCERL